MSTRGLIGFRKGGVDKLTYNHSDSYLSFLGKDVVGVCRDATLDELNSAFDRILMVDENDSPTFDQYEEMGCLNDAGSDNTWYDVLRDTQGRLEAYTKDCLRYMFDSASFINESLHCEWAYIVNLDTGMLEVWKGRQKTPRKGNRYGRKQRNGYYPCAMIAEFPLEDIPEDWMDHLEAPKEDL